ncbi:MAG: hypothetical protein H6888_02775 [Nitratireductor sp.]|nr:hypothetical protein [Nitratireductor sp.]MCC0019978.1 hypothetical protein [Nitratireductor sp.]
MREFDFRILPVIVLSLTLGACQTKSDTALNAVSDNGTETADVVAASETGAEPGVQAEGPVDSEKDPGAEASSIQDSNIVAAYRAPEKGTLFTFRNNWASLPPVITYRVDGTVTLGKAKYLKMTAVRGMGEKISAYYDARNFALKGYRDEKDKAVVTYNPVEERYRFPMQPGDRWVSAWRSRDHRQEKDFKGGGVVTAVGFEDLELPSGKFRTLKIKLPSPPDMPRGMTHYVWFAPDLGVTVKEQIGNGAMNWTQILEKVQTSEDGS